MKRSVLNTLLVALVVLVSIPASAATLTSTNNNNVTATVAAACRWDTQLTVDFAAYDPFAGGADTATATIAFRCTRGTAPTIWFNKTAGNMNAGGADNLAYTLTDASNNPLPITQATAATPAGTAGVTGGFTYVVNGSAVAGQDVAPGSYADTVIVRVEY
jgi:spore coat protein U-like protein